MKTKINIDLRTLLKDNTEAKQEITLDVGIKDTKAQIQHRCIHTETAVKISCPKCESSRFRKSGRIKASKRQRYKCNDCNKSFSLSEKVIDLEALFEEFYDVLYKDKLFMLNTKYRKVKSSKDDPKYLRFFNGRLRQLDFEDRHELKEIIKIAFNDTNMYIDDLEQKLLSKQVDSFTFFLNHKHSDAAYHTKHQHYSLVRTHDVNNYAQQHPNFPLFFCECGSVTLRRHGSNNNGRTRLKCQMCEKIFLIDLKSIIHSSYFETTFKELFSQYFPEFPLLTELTKQMYHDLYHTEFYTYFEDLIRNLDLITHRTKFYVLKLYVLMQCIRCVRSLERFLHPMITNKSDIAKIFEDVARTGDIRLKAPIDEYFNRKERAEEYDRQKKNFVEVKDLDYLRSDSEAIRKILAFPKQYEDTVPELYDYEFLLEGAREDTFLIEESFSGEKEHKTIPY